MRASHEHPGKAVLWMKVTNDELELPLEVHDTAVKLAQACGVTVDSVYASISHYRHGWIKSTPYRKVLVDPDEEVEG